ncbi:hypothetical protein GCM10010967_38630 [Dyadobacter beijingensis]|uniref:Uncharacterized protein n=1 Tax=Dyadobacter beijingensis TaxID=365489 RepID=A0ABQ2I4W7_9BACT|nr:hypothetical protein [Dyadobacter beijingensis]GGN00662.1 hypothetical protein GCM10010967_38630 [Dyadobacter beijingensis]
MENSKTERQIITLIVENGESSLWGRVTYDDNLIVDEAATIDELQAKMRMLLLDFHDLSPESYEFRIEYDVTTLKAFI